MNNHHDIQDDYFTTIDMSKSAPPQADLTDLESITQNQHVTYSTYKHSPLHMNNEKWSINSANGLHHMYHQDSNITFVDRDWPYMPYKNTLLDMVN